MKKWLQWFMPPKEWRLPVLFVSAVLFGLVLLVAHISNATSYLSDDPKACINCHVMTTQYATWQHSSHREVAVCNDCHVPHDNIVRKYFFKAQDGLRHATIFTLRTEPQVIKMHEAGTKVVQENCLRCHSQLVETVSLQSVTAMTASHGDGALCWSCHRETPHGRVNSLAAAPFARVPTLSPIIPSWMPKLMKARRDSLR